MDADAPARELRGPVPPDRVPATAARLAADPLGVVHVRGTVDLGVLDVLARLALAARRRGTRLEVRGGEDLARLLHLCGLAGLVVQPLGQPEAGEQGGVEEVVHVLDPPA